MLKSINYYNKHYRGDNVLLKHYAHATKTSHACSCATPLVAGLCAQLVMCTTRWRGASSQTDCTSDSLQIKFKI